MANEDTSRPGALLHDRKPAHGIGGRSASKQACRGEDVVLWSGLYRHKVSVQTPIIMIGRILLLILAKPLYLGMYLGCIRKRQCYVKYWI